MIPSPIRRGWIGVNPVAQLEPGEKPRWRVEHARILEGAARVRQQLSRHRTPKPLKTDAARREVVLAPAVTRLPRERWLVSS